MFQFFLCLFGQPSTMLDYYSVKYELFLSLFAAEERIGLYDMQTAQTGKPKLKLFYPSKTAQL